jgi:hypothetical protein
MKREQWNERMGGCVSVKVSDSTVVQTIEKEEEEDEWGEENVKKKRDKGSKCCPPTCCKRIGKFLCFLL